MMLERDERDALESAGIRWILPVGSTPIYIRDVAHVRNGYPPQTNIARVDGQRA